MQGYAENAEGLSDCALQDAIENTVRLLDLLSAYTKEQGALVNLKAAALAERERRATTIAVTGCTDGGFACKACARARKGWGGVQ